MKNKVYIWVKEDGDSSFKLFRWENFFYEEIAGTIANSRIASIDNCESFALKAKSSVLFSREFAENIEDLPKQSVYGVIKPSASGVNSMKTFRISNTDGKPLVLYSGGYVIHVDYKKNALMVKSSQQGNVIEELHEAATQVQPIQNHLDMQCRIYAIFQEKIDFKAYWEHRSEMKGMFDAYHNDDEIKDNVISSMVSSKDSSIEQSCYMGLQSMDEIFNFGFNIEHLFDDEISYFQGMYGEENKYSRWLKDNSYHLDNSFDRFFLSFWETIKITITINSTPITERLAKFNQEELLEMMANVLIQTEDMPVLEDGEIAKQTLLKSLEIGEDLTSQNNPNQLGYNQIFDSSLKSYQDLISYNEIEKKDLEPIFILLNLKNLKPTAQHEVVRIIKKSPFAAIYQEAYDEFRQKNKDYFEVLDLRFAYPVEKKSTVLSEQDICCDYGAFRKTYHFNLSMNQLNQLYSKLQDACLLGTETDIRDLASNLTGKYDGKRRATIVDWKGKITDLAVMIGLMMTKCGPKDTWSCSERLFTVNGEDIKWQSLNVLYNRYKNQPPRTPNKVMRLMDEVLGDDFTSKIPKGGNTKGE